MSVQYFTPEGLMQPAPYHHVAVGIGSQQVHGWPARMVGLPVPSCSGSLIGCSAPKDSPCPC